MNIFDRVVSAVNPEKGLQRLAARKKIQIMNSGYSEGGASHSKNAMKGFLGQSKSPLDDIDKNLKTLTQRSRLLYMTSPIATSAIKSNRTNVVGMGLRVKSRIDFEFLGLSRQEADAWEKHTEREFNLWAESKFCDIRGIDNFYELQQVALMGWLLNGDAFAVLHHVKASNHMPYSTRIQLIEADRISTKDAIGSNVEGKHGQNRVLNGVEINNFGQVVAYHICSHYPTSIGKKTWTRVEAITPKTGIPNVIHVMESERAEQYRGVPYLAPVIESLKQITRYVDAELMAAVINGFFTVFITQSEPEEEDEFEGVIADEDKLQHENDLQLGPGAINRLRAGEKVEAVDPKRPNVNFDMFATSMSKYIGAALEIPFEVLLKHFNSSYSASRAALMEAWKSFKMRRSWFVNDFCQPIYDVFLAEAVALGRIQAPGFFSDPLIRKAWCSAEWTGPAPGQIDPVKEVMAAEKRINLCLSTREKETAELTGGDFDKNIEQLILENEKMKGLVESELLANKQ